MPRNRLTGSKVAEFRPDDGGAPIELHRWMQTVQDRIVPRLAVHEFLKVDGAEIEYMGRSPNVYRFALTFVDTDAVETTAGEWRALYNNLVARLDRQTKGILIHPVFGQIRVACQGIDGSAIDIAQSVNSIQVPIAFIDDNIDTKRDPAGLPSVSLRVSDVTDAIEAFETNAAPFLSAATLVTALATSAAAYATAAQAASDDNAEDVALATQLGTVADDTTAAIEAIETDPANEAAADAYAAVAAAEWVHAACIEVDEALRDARPPLIEYVVGADTNILALASILYGPDAQNRIDEILLLNPGLNPYQIPSGTALSLSTPTLV